MAIESATYINQLDATKPGSGDPKSEGDDHLRLLKSAIKATFPNVTGAVTATHSDVNILTGAATGGAVSGLNVTTQATTDNTTKAASTAYVQSAILASSGITAQLPAQSGNSGKFLTTNGSTASWGDAGSLVRSARTSNTVLGTADKSTLIDITSGTFTQTFDACATLGSGWFCYIRNSGTGDITLDPNASETIDGLTSYVMYPGEVRLVQCDGSALRTVVLNAFYRTFTGSGTFTKPPGYTAFEGLLWGGGGGGIKESTNAIGGGGGACAPIKYLSGELPSSIAFTIAATSAGSSTTTGNSGNNSTFHTTTAYGAQAITGTNAGGMGGSAYVANISNSTNSAIGGAAPTATQQAFFGGAAGGVISGRSPTVYGGGGGGGIYTSAVQPIYGTTVFGGAGGAAGDAVSGGDGQAPGGGGGSTRTGAAGGAGAGGELRIWGII